MSVSSRHPALTLERLLPRAHFGTVFMSNYLEHLDSVGRRDPATLGRAPRCSRRAGGSIVLQPNIRLVGPRYWDFIDHRVALTERSLLEAAEFAGLRTHTLVTRFLPYSTKGRLPSGAAARPRLPAVPAGVVGPRASRPCTSGQA